MELLSSESCARGDDDDDDDEADVPKLHNLANFKLHDSDSNAHVNAFSQDDVDGMKNGHIEDHRFFMQEQELQESRRRRQLCLLFINHCHNLDHTKLPLIRLRSIPHFNGSRPLLYGRRLPRV